MANGSEVALGLVLFGQNNKIQFELLVGNVTLWDTVFEAVQRPPRLEGALGFSREAKKGAGPGGGVTGRIAQGLGGCSSNDFFCIINGWGSQSGSKRNMGTWSGALGLHHGAGPAGGLEMGSPVLNQWSAVKEGRAVTPRWTISLCLLASEGPVWEEGGRGREARAGESRVPLSLLMSCGSEEAEQL